MKHIENPYSSAACFFCGPNNPVGHKLTFEETETEPNELVCLVSSRNLQEFRKYLARRNPEWSF